MDKNELVPGDVPLHVVSKQLPLTQRGSLEAIVEIVLEYVPDPSLLHSQFRMASVDVPSQLFGEFCFAFELMKYFLHNLDELEVPMPSVHEREVLYIEVVIRPHDVDLDEVQKGVQIDR